MIVDLKQCVNPDSTFDVYFEGLKAVISHDADVVKLFRYLGL